MNRIWKSCCLILVCTLMASAAILEAGDEVVGTYRGLQPVVKFDVSPPLTSITPLPPTMEPGGLMIDPPGDSVGERGPEDVDPIVQDWLFLEAIPSPLVSFDGPSVVGSISPPDSVGDVGPNHYVAMSNLRFAVYDKTGNLLYGPANNNTLWSGFGGDCQTDNSGDPIVLYDQLADRWILTQFTASGPTYLNCVAVSTSPDPTGTYYRYAVNTGTNFPDYPKYGVWPDGYYISTREFGGSGFAGVGAYAIDRAQVIAGNPSPTIVSFLVPPGSTPYNVGDGLLPSDIDGSTLPPAGSPNFYVGSMDNGGQYGAPQDALTIWKFDADFATPGNSSFTLTDTVSVAPYDSQFPCSPGSRNCIPQPSTSNKIDILSYRQRPMHRLAYRNFGSHESLVANQSVEAAPNMAGIRWYEIRDPDGAPTVFQQGTFAPGVSDGIHRWMGSIAMDEAGNVALGYSASDSVSTYPSSWYTGRLSDDPLGTLPQGEGSIIDGTGSQTGSSRWGDYTSMNIDPVDDCTFWFVNQYVPTTSSTGWRLRIGAFRFAECGTADFTLEAGPDSVAICVGTDAEYGVDIDSIAGFSNPVTLSASGHPAGTTANFSVNPVTPPGTSDMTIGNTGAAAAGSYVITVSGIATASPGHSDDVGLDVFDSEPGIPTLISPPNGAVNQPLTPSFNWTAGTGSVAFTIEIATDAGFTNIVESATLESMTYTPGAPLSYNQQYFWRVRASNPCGPSPNSTVFSFSTLFAPAAFHKTAPADGATNQLKTLELIWGTSQDAASYEFCYDTVDNDFCDASWTNVGGSTSTQVGNLDEDTTYFWQVQAVNPAGTTEADHGEWWHFRTLGLPFDDGFESGDTAAWSATIP